MTTLALLAAAVATAVVGICEFTQVRTLQYRVWRLERRRDQVERHAQRVGAAARARRTPRSILAEPRLREVGSDAGVRPAHRLGESGLGESGLGDSVEEETDIAAPGTPADGTEELSRANAQVPSVRPTVHHARRGR